MELLADVVREQLEQLPNFDRHVAVLEWRLLGLLEKSDELAQMAETFDESLMSNWNTLPRTQMLIAIREYRAAKAVASEGKKRL